jgi:hypothetical protein
MTTTAPSPYPTAASLVSEIKSFISTNDVIVSDWDAFVYGFISNTDEQFRNDPEWYAEDDTDLKDSLRDEVLELLGLN